MSWWTRDFFQNHKQISQNSNVCMLLNILLNSVFIKPHVIYVWICYCCGLSVFSSAWSSHCQQRSLSDQSQSCVLFRSELWVHLLLPKGRCCTHALNAWHCKAWTGEIPVLKWCHGVDGDPHIWRSSLSFHPVQYLHRYSYIDCENDPNKSIALMFSYGLVFVVVLLNVIDL